MSKDLEAFSVDFGMRLDQIDRTGSVTDEDHGDIDYYNIDDSTNSFAVSLGRELSDSLNMSIGYASVERLPLRIRHPLICLVTTRIKPP